MNWIAIIVAALVPMALGMIYYNPKVFGTAWMKAAGVTPDAAKTANLPLIYGLSLFFAFLLAMSLQPIVIHQWGVTSALLNAVEDPARAVGAKAILEKFQGTGEYAAEFRTFGHGFFHGVLISIFFVLPIFATNAMFERKSAKYILINVFYWLLTISVMGGIISAWR